jgi:chemotaxis methyl-accepting protein methylase/signal transduction histidine kinase
MSPKGNREKPAGSRSRSSKRATGAKTRPVEPPHAAASRGQSLVVGIGASAGGLEALKAFFGSMPPESGLVFVVVVHLDPTHSSLMPELLARTTPLSVEQAHDRQPLEANHVYIIPPNRTLTVDQGLLRVREVADRRGLRGTIDHFFRSLAADQRSNAVGIVLSGTGTEGMLGARAIKAEEGLVMAQAPDTASQPSMPENVIATGIVDFVLAPDKMPRALLEYARDTRAHRAPAVAAPDVKPLNGLQPILAVLRTRTKHDFRGYKKGTLHRRIERRMALQQIPSAAKYLDFLRSHPAEVDQLAKDLLIGVTSFFRDAEAFEELASKVVAGLVKEREPDTPIRVWVPGCATGEEAYSIAMVLAEQIDALQSPGRVQIFATDLDEHALETARTGTYPETISLDVSPQRLQRFFTREDHRYTIVKSLRDSVTFAGQNLLSDPPFSRLDLVSCRNVLIYLEPEVQQKLLAVFHFALNAGGHLMLGSAEGVGTLEDLFSPVSKQRRIFRRRGPVKRPPLDFPAPYLTLGEAARVTAKAAPEPAPAALADQQLLEYFAPAAVVVRRTGQIVRFYGAMDRYIHLPTGDATLDVLALARDTLKPSLRAALYDAVRNNRQKVFEVAGLNQSKVRATLRITVRPLGGPMPADDLWLMIFEELPASPRLTRRAEAAVPSLVHQLESELRATKKEQQQLVEQLESANEELKAANEEVLSMNEELQSTNEELITSKEELQSMNEELTTLNQQLQEKVQELTAVNDDVANLLVSTDIATVFLDDKLRIKRFTTAATQLLNLLPADVGRPITHISTNLVNIDLARDAQTVLNRATPLEREASAQDGKQYFLRILPYRSSEGRVIQGVVLTLVDLTPLKETERELRAARAQMAEDLRRMTRLHQASARLPGLGDAREMQEEILRAALEITGAEMGNVQRADEAGGLRIAAQVGFEPPFVEFFACVDSHTDPVGAAMTASHRVTVNDVTTSPMFAGTAALQVLLAAGVRALQSTPLFDRSNRFLGMLSTYYRSVHYFLDSELRWVDLLARHVADVIGQQQTEELLARAQERLEHHVADRTKWLALMHEVTQAINDAPSWNEGLRLVLRRICEVEHWQIGYVYLPDRNDSNVISPVISQVIDERMRTFHEATEGRRFTRGQNLPGRVYAEGAPQWVNGEQELVALLPFRGEAARQVGLKACAALPIRFGPHVIAVLELFSDQPHAPSDVLADLMNDIGTQIGKVLERQRLEAQFADLVWREQQGLLHTLHDSLGQTLAGLGMMASALSRRVMDGDTAAMAETATQISQQAQRAVAEVRELATNLFPVEIEAHNLTAALRRLASTTEQVHKIPVRVRGRVPEDVREGVVASQLYRIAQEALTNAVKHAKASTINIRIGSESGMTTLRIIDDGVGIQKTAHTHEGVGLGIMKFRAQSIGGTLIIEPGADRGTVVTCTLRAIPLVTTPSTP